MGDVGGRWLGFGALLGFDCLDCGSDCSSQRVAHVSTIIEGVESPYHHGEVGGVEFLHTCEEIVLEKLAEHLQIPKRTCVVVSVVAL